MGGGVAVQENSNRPNARANALRGIFDTKQNWFQSERSRFAGIWNARFLLEVNAMAHATTHPGYDFTPEEAISEIKAERKRKSLIAGAAFAAGALALAAGAYFSYRDVPAPANPANFRPHLVEPYH
jgi:hypothetical protein